MQNPFSLPCRVPSPTSCRHVFLSSAYQCQLWLVPHALQHLLLFRTYSRSQVDTEARLGIYISKKVPRLHDINSSLTIPFNFRVQSLLCFQNGSLGFLRNHEKIFSMDLRELRTLELRERLRIIKRSQKETLVHDEEEEVPYSNFKKQSAYHCWVSEH